MGQILHVKLAQGRDQRGAPTHRLSGEMIGFELMFAGKIVAQWAQSVGKEAQGKG